MSHPAINLVCTRCTNGDTASLRRWYNDHAQLLMASPALQGAQLFALNQATAGMDYFCLYHFAQMQDFAAFDSGDVMERVRQQSNAAPGRSSIEIVKRTQYERVLHRRWLAASDGGAVQAVLLQIPSHALAQTTRWLNDVLYTLHLRHPLQSVQAYHAAQSEHGELFVLIESAQPASTDWLAWSSPYAERAPLETIWQAHSERIARWLK